MIGRMDGVRNVDGVVDGNGFPVSPLDDDYGFWKRESDRSEDPLDDDYVREEYR